MKVLLISLLLFFANYKLANIDFIEIHNNETGSLEDFDDVSCNMFYTSGLQIDTTIVKDQSRKRHILELLKSTEVSKLSYIPKHDHAYMVVYLHALHNIDTIYFLQARVYKYKGVYYEYKNLKISDYLDKISNKHRVF
ncbi:MAG: hypothetical protein JST70_04860 [Bacteroidetes bacterium]|nr:hypothetical protein [Bacteroidota bacterium]